MGSVAESHVEEATLAWLEEQGYAIGAGPEHGPDGATPERTSYGDVVLAARLREAIARLNPEIPRDIQEEVFRRIVRTEKPSLVEENRRLHELITGGVPVEVPRPDGSIGGELVRVVDFDNADANDWLALNQVTVIEDRVNRRPDVVVFLNGMPVGVIELKNPGDENATLDGAFNQLQTYKNGIPSLFRTNAVLIISDGLGARIGSLTANRERFSTMAGAIEWVLAFQQEAAAKEKSTDAKKKAHKRFGDAVVALAKAFALASASEAARTIREEVGFFQAIRAALVKSEPSSGKSRAERELAIQQLVSRAVVSTEIVDIMQAAGIESPDISILSDDFLAEVRELDKKNLALEALRKLINGEVRSQSKRNITQAKAFSERLEEAIARYHANAISTVQVLEELIALAKDIRAARERGQETGLSDQEIAFYDALADNNSARDLMGEPQLRIIAHELVEKIRGNLTVDWMHMETSRARMRVLVKRILRKYGYPPDLQDAAVQTVLQQAEALSQELASAGN